MTIYDVLKYHVHEARNYHRQAMAVRRRKGNIMVYEILMRGRKAHMQMCRTIVEWGLN